MMKKCKHFLPTDKVHIVQSLRHILYCQIFCTICIKLWSQANTVLRHNWPLNVSAAKSHDYNAPMGSTNVCQNIFLYHYTSDLLLWNHIHFQIEKSAELGRYLVAARDLKAGEVLFEEPPLVVGPVVMTPPVCLHCYTPVDGSFKCRKSGWPLCGPTCEKAVSGNPEVVIPQQTGKQTLFHPSYN